MKTFFYLKGFTRLLLFSLALISLYLYLPSLEAAATPKTTSPEAAGKAKAGGTAPAATTIGQVVWVKGVVKATTEGGQTRDLQRRSPIFAKDTIVTDKTSTGEIVFSDNSIVALTTDTAIRIDDYQFGKNTPPNKAKFVASLVKGGFRTITGLIPKQNASNYQVNTAVATIGVRGTSYAVSFTKQLYIKYYSGTPCVNNTKGTFCLDMNNPYAGVASNDSAPIRLPQDPGVFKGQPDIVPASFTIEPSSLTPGGSSGGVITPKNNSFCIQ